MEASSGEYRFTRLENVIFGPGKIAALEHQLQRRGLERALVITGATLGRSQALEKVTDALGGRLAGVFTGARQHVPSQTVSATADEARRVEADCLVSFGGGSPIDTAKAAALSLLPSRELIHLAVPTTLSAGEFTPFGGVTDEKSRRKGGVGDARLQARCVILDPRLTLETPAWLWASTGVKALDHAVECSYSERHQIFSDTLAARAIALLREHLPASLKSHGEDEIAHRGACQIAAWMSMAGISSGLGLSHALGHQIGARWDVPHGVTSCITAPHVMRLMAAIAPERFGAIAEGFEVELDRRNPRPGALECAERAARFIGSLSVPTRLGQLGVPREELPQIAEAVLAEINRAGALGRPLDTPELLAILEAAY